MVKEKLPPATDDQLRAWGFYGTPHAPATKDRVNQKTTFSTSGKQVGEVRYIVGWMADQMVRMGWRILIDGSTDWTLALPGGETIESKGEVGKDVETDETHPANASRKVLESIAWDERTVREVTTNLFVAGELHYALDTSETWRVVSVIRPDREELLQGAKVKVRGIWPHPADPEAPDAPLFGVLNILDDLLWLNLLSRSQSANRAGMRGILGVSDSWKVAGQPDSTSADFWTQLEAALSRPMESPDDVSPVGLVGPLELVTPKDGGMVGLTWSIPEFPYDDKIDEKMRGKVQRLAYGLPIPPEVLLGLQAQSKATAFQVEGSTYRAHIEPVALLVSQIATDTLKLFVELGGKQIKVVPDPTVILARRSSVADVFEAHDRGIVSDAYTREVIGIPQDAAPDEEEMARRAKAKQPTIVDGVSDPANDAAEPINAAAQQMPGDLTPRQEEAETEAAGRLSGQLHTIDSTLFYELVGASHAAVAKAHERLGARVRASSKLKSLFPAELSNEDLGREHAEEILSALSIDGEKIVNAALEGVVKWWAKRLSKAMEQTEAVLAQGDVAIEWDSNAPLNSMLTLHKILSAAVTGSPLAGGEAVIAAAGFSGLNEADLRAVMDLTNGSGTPGVAMGQASMLALTGAGVTIVGHRWQWNPGRMGQTFDPHLERDHVAVFNVEGFVGDNAGEWGALPGQGVNAKYCMCTTRWLLRGADGRFLKERNHK